MYSNLPLSVNDAMEEILSRMAPLPARHLPLDDSLGLVMAEDIMSTENLPPFPNSAMDGFAVHAADVAFASPDHPARLRILADAPAGSVLHCEVASGTAVRIMTGAQLPRGTEAVVPVEHTAAMGSFVVISRPIKMGANLRMAGEDVGEGETILFKGSVVRPAEIGLLAAIGRIQVPVIPVPRVAVMTTGAELVDAGESLTPGRIRDANLHSLCAQVRALGIEALPFPRVPDRREAVAAAIHGALVACDVVITNGGISVGDYDFVKETLEGLGATSVFGQVNQKPGRPFAFWMLHGKPIFGLPGNPVAAMVCFEVYVRPALRKMLGLPFLFRPKVSATLMGNYRKAGADPRTHFLRVIASHEEGVWRAAPTGPQGSGILSSMTRANAIVEIPGSADGLEGGSVDLHLTDLPEDH